MTLFVSSPTHRPRKPSLRELEAPFLDEILTRYPAIGKYKPQDATTNPSLILAAAKKPEYAHLIDAAVAYGKQHGSSLDEKVDATLDRLLVEFGREILNIVPGKVSTEVDARFSFDTQGSVDKALRIIEVSLPNPHTNNSKQTN